MKANIVIYTGQFKATLNNNIKIDDERDKEALISSFEPRLKIVKANLDQLYKETTREGKLSTGEELAIIEEARKFGIDYYTEMLTSLKNIFDIY
jgi:hypothetical protein